MFAAIHRTDKEDIKKRNMNSKNVLELSVCTDFDTRE